MSPDDTARTDNEELTEQMDDMAQRKDILNDSAPEVCMVMRISVY
jgi:hypothetical protein